MGWLLLHSANLEMQRIGSGIRLAKSKLWRLDTVQKKYYV